MTFRENLKTYKIREFLNFQESPKCGEEKSDFNMLFQMLKVYI